MITELIIIGKNISKKIKLNMEGISLGWNCSGAIDGVKLGLRKTKEEGYKTCPFDMMNSNYIGMCKCIEDDFKYFCDPNYLELRKGPKMSVHIPNQNDEEYWIYNTYYNFAFNHEAPGHGSLYLSERWVGGIEHFVVNNFENFIIRYNKRIENFRNYLKNSDYINFILWRYNSIPYELLDIILKKYPNLKFKINTIINFGPHTKNCLIVPSNVIAYEKYFLEYMNITKENYPNELLRYEYNMQFADNLFINDNILLIDASVNKHLSH